MNKFVIASFFMLLSSVAFAQQQPSDPIFLTKAIISLQAQRNQALDQAATADARISVLAEQIEKSNIKIKELEDKIKSTENNKNNSGEESPKQ